MIEPNVFTWAREIVLCLDIDFQGQICRKHSIDSVTSAKFPVGGKILFKLQARHSLTGYAGRRRENLTGLCQADLIVNAGRTVLPLILVSNFHSFRRKRLRLS